MLPVAAVTHFENLCTDSFAESGRRLHDAQREFDAKESARGSGRGGSGYAARLSALYVSALERSVGAVVDHLKTVHGTFGLSTAPEVQTEILELAERTVENQIDNLEGAFSRHITRFGCATPANGLGAFIRVHTGSATNRLRLYFWTLENVPMPMERQVTPAPIIDISGSGNVIQVGDNAVAHVSQTWNGTDAQAIVAALQRFRTTVEGANSDENTIRQDLLAAVDHASREIAEQSPDRGRLARWLGSIASAIQTIPALRPAWDEVAAVLRALGLPI